MSDIASVVLEINHTRFDIQSKKELKPYSNTRDALDDGLIPTGDKPFFINGESQFGVCRGLITIYVDEDIIPDDAVGFVYGNQICQRLHDKDVTPSWGDKYSHLIPLQFYKKR